MLKNNSAIMEAIEYLNTLMVSYARTAILEGNKDSIIITPESLFNSASHTTTGGKHLSNLITETKAFIENTYLDGRKLKMDAEIYNKLFNYALLFSGMCFIIQLPDEYNSYYRKELYTLSESELISLYNHNLLVAKDVNEDVADKAAKIICNIREGRKLVKTLVRNSSYLEGLYTVRLDKAYHIEEDMRMHYIPISPTGTIDLNSAVILPLKGYIDICNLILHYAMTGAVCIKESNRTTLATANMHILDVVYGKERTKEIIEQIGFVDDKLILPELGGSRYTTGVRWYNLENIDKISILPQNIVECLLKKTEICVFGKMFDLSLVDTDVRGAKKYLKEFVNYDSLSEADKMILDGYSNEDAFLYMQKKGITGFKSYTERFGNLNKSIMLPSTEDELREILRSGIYEITLLTKKGENKIICTTNQNIIEEVYGEDYRIYCNALNSRLREFYNKLTFAVRQRNETAIKRLIYRDMMVKFGISYSMLGLDNKVDSYEEVLKALELKVSEIKESTQNYRQILVTSLTDSKPKEGYGRNLTRSFYLDNILKIVKLR